MYMALKNTDNLDDTINGDKVIFPIISFVSHQALVILGCILVLVHHLSEPMTSKNNHILNHLTVRKK